MPGLKENLIIRTPEYSVASLFCGAGGLDMGFERVGFKTIWANDFNEDATITMKTWCKDAKIVCGDITKIPAMMIYNADIMLGGFPCQGFSSMGNRDVDDSKNFLYKQYIRVLKVVKPYIFVGENVEGMLTMLNGAVVDKIINDFASIGYNVHYDFVNSADYGVPQDRKRVIIVGIRKDLDIPFPVPKLRERVSMRQVFKGLPVEFDESDLHDGGYSPRFMSVNRKRGWDEQSYTILATARSCPFHPSSPDMIKVGERNWRFGDNGRTRRFTWWEAAIIQSFPRGMYFHGSLESKYRQVGNAVPPLLGQVYAEEIYKLLKENGVKGSLVDKKDYVDNF